MAVGSHLSVEGALDGFEGFFEGASFAFFGFELLEDALAEEVHSIEVGWG